MCLILIMALVFLVRSGLFLFTYHKNQLTICSENDPMNFERLHAHGLC